jgi:hypothetical protein
MTARQTVPLLLVVAALFLHIAALGAAARPGIEAADRAFLWIVLGDIVMFLAYQVHRRS